MAEKNIKYEIKETIGVIGNHGTYQKILARISWNGGEPAWDIRNWRMSEDGKNIPLKGVSLNDEDMKMLKELLVNLEV